MNTKLVTVWLAVFAVVGCTRSPFEDDTDPKRGLLLTTSQVDYEPWLATAGGAVRLPVASKALQTNFQKSDAIGVFIYSGTALPAIGAHSTNMRYFTQDGVPDGSTTAPIWTAATAMGGALVGGTAYQTTAYCPYNATSTDGTAVPHSVALDQTATQATNGTAGAFELSDFLWAPSVPVVNPTSVPAATFVFQHLMARLQLEVDVPTIIDGVAVTKLNSLSIKNVHTQATINLGTGAVAVLPASGVVVPRALNKVTAAGQVATYEAILIPQTVPMGTIVVEMKCQTGAGEKVASYYPPAGGLPLESGKKVTLRLTAPADIAFTQTPDLSVGAAVVDQVLKIKVAAGTTWTLTAPSSAGNNWLTLSATAGGAYGYSLTQASTGSEQTVYVKAAQNSTANPREVRVNLTALIGGINQTVAWTAVQNYNVPTVFPTTSFVFDDTAPYSFPSLAGNTSWYVKVDPTNWDGLRLATRPKAWAELTAADTLSVAAASTAAQPGVQIYGNYINTNGQLYLVADPAKVHLTTIWCQNKATVVDTRSVLVTHSDGSKLRWARGNLVATKGGAVPAGTNGSYVKIGNPFDGGMYFQFGSLIGWKGGNIASGGKGTGVLNAPAIVSANTTAWTTTASIVPFSWNNDAMVWPQAFTNGPAIGSAFPTNLVDNTYYFGYQNDPYNKIGKKLSDFPNFTSGGLVSPTCAVGDPCRYYLGGTWRLPTAEDYGNLCFNKYPNGTVGGAWSGVNEIWGNPTTNTYNLRLIRSAQWNVNTLSDIPGRGYYVNTTALTPLEAAGDVSSIFFASAGGRGISGIFNWAGTLGYYSTASASAMHYGVSAQWHHLQACPQTSAPRMQAQPVRCVMD